MPQRLMSFFGLVTILALAWLLSNNRRVMEWRLMGAGIALQLLFAAFILKTTIGHKIFSAAQEAVNALIALSDLGATFVFGADFSEHFFAFKVLPTIIFVSSLSYLLFYWGLLQKVIRALALLMQRSMNISGAEGLVTAANVFLGQTEAPLFVKPYLKTMTRAEIHTMMTGGMATVAGGVLAAYVGFGISAGHLLAASFMAAPASLVIARMMYPETEVSATRGAITLSFKLKEVNAFEAACVGAREGLMLSLNVGAMLIAFIALVGLVNLGLAQLGSLLGVSLTLEGILGILFQPFAFVMGVPWEDCNAVGRMLGEKMVLNEFIAYKHLSEAKIAGTLSERAQIITTYALCGFANFSSIAIQIGGIGALEPSRQQDFAACAFRAMIAGTLASFMTATIAGMLL